MPPTWNSFSSQGYDSKVGGITNGRDTLLYDYGWYSYNFRQETTATHNRTTLSVDGRQGLLVQPKRTGEGIVGLYVEVDGQNKFNLYGRNITDEITATNIMRSVKFK